MARDYSKKNHGIKLYGFDEYIEALTRLENVTVDEAAKDCFEKCCDIVVNSLDKKMMDANVPASLKSKTSKFKVFKHNQYMFSYGWGKADKETFDKVCYLNYGTPVRHTNKDGQRVRIDGKWVTLGADRGKITPRYFISDAKRAAAQKMRKVQKDALKEIMDGLKK